MQWLQDKLPEPRVLCFEKQNGKKYLLMTKISGTISYDDKYMKNPEQLTSILAEGIQMLWKVDIADCPDHCDLDKRLQRAKYNVENNLVDWDNAEPDTFGENGLKNPKQLLEWLIQNRPKEELVLSHGDFCLPNIFINGGKISGFIDLGKTGIADKWQDIALCYHSLKHNFDGKYTKRIYEGLESDRLYERLGVTPNWNKIRYYILLDELF